MGGLISREYIDRFMPSAPGLNGSPVVKTLVTLGTPHDGTPCWLLAPLSASQLSPTYVSLYFQDHSLNGVELHTLGGNVDLACILVPDSIEPFDPVVNLEAALSTRTWRRPTRPGPLSTPR